MNPDQFRRVEDQYVSLMRRLAAGRLTAQQYEERLRNLVVEDSQGQVWRMGDNGRWYVNDGTAWVAARPPLAEEKLSDKTSPAPGSCLLRTLAILVILFLCVFDAAGVALLTNRDALAGGLVPTAFPQLRLPIPEPTLNAPSFKSSANPTPTVTPTRVPAQAPTLPATPPGLRGNSPSDIPTAVPLASPTLGPGTPPVPASSQPGLFVLSMRLDPVTPKRQQNVTFYVTFLNSTNVPQPYRWVVFIFNAENSRRPFGQTSGDRPDTIPPGTSEWPSLGPWKLMSPGPCETVVARVAFLNQAKEATLLTTPEGQVFERKITFCPE